jgi:hypothetical protein
MNWQQDKAGESLEMDLELEQALTHFKASMDAWSDHAMSRPRTAAKLAVRRTWRLATGWALACVVLLGSLAVGVHAVVHRQELARQAAQKEAAQRAVAAQPAAQPTSAQPVSAQSGKKAPSATVRKVNTGAQDNAGNQDDALLASVDSDVSRQVPAAMEPLAQLMDDNGSQ